MHNLYDDIRYAAIRGKIEWVMDVINLPYKEMQIQFATHALQKAAKYGQLSVVRHMYEHCGATLTWKALRNAVSCNHVQVTEYLCGFPEVIDFDDEDGIRDPMDLMYLVWKYKAYDVGNFIAQQPWLRPLLYGDNYQLKQAFCSGNLPLIETLLGYSCESQIALFSVVAVLEKQQKLEYGAPSKDKIQHLITQEFARRARWTPARAAWCCAVCSK